MLENYARNTFKLENLFLKKLILEKFGEARKFLILEKFQTQEDLKLEISASKKIYARKFKKPEARKYVDEKSEARNCSINFMLEMFSVCYTRNFVTQKMLENF